LSKGYPSYFLDASKPKIGEKIEETYSTADRETKKQMEEEKQEMKNL